MAGARLHSLLHYYGLFAGLTAALPALALLLFWRSAMTSSSASLRLALSPASPSGNLHRSRVLAQISNVVAGINFGEQPDWVYDAAEAWAGWQATSTTLKTITVPALSLLGGLFAYRMLNPSFRSRNAVDGSCRCWRQNLPSPS